MKARDKKEKYEKICQKKVTTQIDVLCKGCPSEIQEFLEYARRLRFEEKPDYDYLRGLLKKAYQRLEFPNDMIFDWTIPMSDKKALKKETPPLVANGNNQNENEHAEGKDVVISKTPGEENKIIANDSIKKVGTILDEGDSKNQTSTKA